MKQFKKPSKQLISRRPMWTKCGKSSELKIMFLIWSDDVITTSNTSDCGGRMQTNRFDSSWRMWRMISAWSPFSETNLPFFTWTSCRGNNCTIHVYIQQDLPDQWFKPSVSLATVSHQWYYLKSCMLDTERACLNACRADPLSPKWCQTHSRCMVFHSWNCALTTQGSWHNWSQLDMGLCRWIPETMLPSVSCLGQG